MKFLRLIYLILVPAALSAQTLHQEDAGLFVRALLWDEDSLNSWFDQGSVAMSHRLGTEYDGVRYKHLISYDLEDTVKEMVRNKRLSYSVTVDSLGREYACVRV